MVKSREQIKKERKSRHARLKEANGNLKSTKNWYPTTDKREHFKRKTKVPRKQRLRASINPGQVLIVLAGRFRGRRVIFLKQLDSGLLLVTGPYKLNGVPLKRVNQSYVISTKTRVNLKAIKHLENIKDDFFTTKLKTGLEKKNDFFENPEQKRVSYNF